MRTLLYILFILAFSITGCNKYYYNTSDLPSNELIDSVILSTINSCQDSAVGGWLPSLFSIDSELGKWSIPLRKENLKKVNYSDFHLDYIKFQLSQQGYNNLFDLEDSLFIYFQIGRKNQITFSKEDRRNISYINREEIRQKLDLLRQGQITRFSYCQLNKPLFNRSKTIAIVGLSLFDYSSERHEGGFEMIMKRQGNDWVFLTDIDWWGH